MHHGTEEDEEDDGEVAARDPTSAAQESVMQTSQSWRACPAAITVLSRNHSTRGLDVKRGNGKGDALDEGKKLEGKKEMADTKRVNKRMK